MNTITHMLVATALLSRKGQKVANRAVLAGALVPDIWMVVFYGWARLNQGMTEGQIWSDAYWQEPWQTIGAVANSVPLALLILAISLARKWRVGIVFAAALLTHAGLDLPVHNDDAHRHFWPLSDWRFISPLSYWEVEHHARWVQPVETLLSLGAIVVLWQRFNGLWLKVLLGLTAILTITFAGLVIMS